MTEWQTAPAEGLEDAIAEFKAKLPGWWFTVGECQVSADGSCGPTRESPHIALIPNDRRFDDGFHADLPQPATMAAALRDVMEQALAAISKGKRQMTEREKIVAWLREQAEEERMVGYISGQALADAIERGDHLKRPEPTIPASAWKNVPSVGH